MKYVRTLGLAAVATLALIAFAGAGTASATVLCKTEPTGGGIGTTGTTCPEGWAYQAGTELHTVLDPGAGSFKLTTEFKTIECGESTWSVITSKEGSTSETVTGEVKNQSFGGCNCETKVLKAGQIEIHWIPDTLNGTITSSGAEVTQTCSTIFGKVHCIFATNGTDLGKLTGGSPATLDIESADIPRLTTNALCDQGANWDAKFEFTTPIPLYVAGET